MSIMPKDAQRTSVEMLWKRLNHLGTLLREPLSIDSAASLIRGIAQQNTGAANRNSMPMTISFQPDSMTAEKEIILGSYSRLLSQTDGGYANA